MEQVVQISNQNLLDTSRLNDANYVTNIEKSGFFIAPCKLANILKDENRIVLGIKDENHVLAYIWLTKKIEIQEYTWTDKTAQAGIINQEAYFLKKIGMVQTQQGRGLGTTLMNNLGPLLKNHSIKFLYALVAYNPIKNLASIGFNLKHGLKQVAISPKVTYSGFKDYQCVLFAKELIR